MANIPYLPLFVEPFMMDTDHLTDAELGLYTRILVKLWVAPGRRFPNDVEWLARKFRRTVDETETTIMPLVREFLRTSGNWIWSERLSKEFDRVSASIAKQSARAKARYQNGEIDQNPSRTRGDARVTRGESDSDPDKPLNDCDIDVCRGTAGPAMPSTSTSTLQKETPTSAVETLPFPKESCGGETRAHARARTAPASRSLALQDLILDDELIAIAEAEDRNAERELERFRDHCAANGRTYKDYRAAFRNWLRTSYGKANGHDVQLKVLRERFLASDIPG